MKIIIGPSKTFNLAIDTKVKNPRPVFIEGAREIFYNYIKPLTLEETKNLYHLSERKTLEVYKMHQTHGQKFYNAIEMYNGAVFKQLKLDQYDPQWLNEHLLIIDALYGVIKPYDLIAPYRLYFDLRPSFLDLKKFWKQKINDFLKEEDLILNLASKEYSSLITHHNMISPKFSGNTMEIKKGRGLMLHTILLNKKYSQIL